MSEVRLEDLKAVVQKTLELGHEIAKLTEATWDDKVVESVHNFFDLWFGPVKFFATADGVLAVPVAAEKAGVPEWLLPLLGVLVKQLLEKFFSK